MLSPRISYVNGRYVPHRSARVSIEDRGYQYADGVYEVVLVKNGKWVDGEAHIERLSRSLKEVKLKAPWSDAIYPIITKELLRQNKVCDTILYIHITRGVYTRQHPFPPVNVKPALVIIPYRPKLPSEEIYEKGLTLVSCEDERWARCDIKSISLLPNALAKQYAVEQGGNEALLLSDGLVREGSSTNVFMVRDGEIVTHPISNHILGGIMRARIITLAESQGINVSERVFSYDEVLSADEVFISSTTMGAMPISVVDGQKIGAGKAGEITLQLHRAYDDYIRKMSEI